MTVLRLLACIGLAISVPILLIAVPAVRAEVTPAIGAATGIDGVQASRSGGHTSRDHATGGPAVSGDLDDETDDDDDVEPSNDTVQLLALKSGRHDANRFTR